MKILMIGGGICGLGTALMLGRDGHDVTVLERDEASLPASGPAAWDTWERSGVAQFRQPHNLMPGSRLLFDAELPDINEALVRAGASKYDLVNPLPRFLADHTPRPIDNKLWCYTARRPVAEWVLADAAAREPRVTIQRGTRVSALLTGPSSISGVPHVAGVRTSSGDEHRADLVIDASGRQSRSPEWLTSMGARAPYEEHADSGFAYYTRYFQGTEPERRGPVLAPIGTISLLTLTGDNDTWSVTVFTATGDAPLKKLRDGEKWTKTVRACPLHAHWLDGEPISDVLPMAGIVDRYRRFVVDGTPVATGFAAVADAWACTNPSAGRGLTVGFLHARTLRNVLRESDGNPEDVVKQFDARTEAEIAPWYYAQIAVDRARFAEMEALREGRQPERPADPLAQSILSFLSVMPASPDLFRSGLEYIATVSPVQEILSRPEVAGGVAAAAEAMKGMPPMRIPGPDRQQLLDLLK
jgi:2-polyprenyl-6-methoxyphenol hydroxylase-like FAD-dependent oxidoreductase